MRFDSDRHISQFSLYCSPFLLLLLKAMDRPYQGRLSKSVGWNDQLQHRRPGNKTMLVLCNHIKCLQPLSFNNSGCDLDCHSLCLCVSLCGVFSFTCLQQPRGKWGSGPKLNWCTWDAAGTSTCSSHPSVPWGPGARNLHHTISWQYPLCLNILVNAKLIFWFKEHSPR